MTDVVAVLPRPLGAVKLAAVFYCLKNGDISFIYDDDLLSCSVTRYHVVGSALRSISPNSFHSLFLFAFSIFFPVPHIREDGPEAGMTGGTACWGR